jgi:transglutaminase-like putative cysteine protease
VAQVVLGGMLALVAALPAARAFAPVGGAVPAQVVRAVLVAVAAAVGYGVLAVLWRREAVTTVLGVLAVAGAVAMLARPGGEVLSGPFRLLSAALPADPTGPELATVAALAGYTALATAYLILRGAAVPALLPPTIALVLGLALTASTGGPPAWCAPAFVALAALVVLAGQPQTAPRLVAGAAAVAVIAALAVPWLAAATPNGDRKPADARSLVAASVRPRQQVDPMAQFRALADGKLRVEIAGTANGPVPRLRMVTLTAFDGAAWTVRADYRRAATHLPPADGSARRTTASADLTIATPEAVGWLPTPGRAAEVSVAGLGVDGATGDLVVPEGSATPRRYRVTGTTPAVTAEEVRADHPAGPASLDVPLPADLVAFVRAVTAGGSDDFDRFSALYERMAGAESPFRVDTSPTPPAGNGYYQLSNLIRDHRGTSEQYAAAFAAFCRYLGWDARVVLGFRTTQRADRIAATGRDVAAWVEVRFARLGWIPVDPTPTRDITGAAAAPAPSNPVGAAVDADQHDRTHPAQPAPHPATPRTAPPTRPPSDHTAVIALSLLAAALAVLLAAASIPLTNARRRHRRRSAPDPRAQVHGAWREAVDALAAHRVPVPYRATTGSTVTAAGPAGAPHLAQLATQADHAGYAPEPTTPAEAADAWNHTTEVRRRARAAATPYTRLRALLTRPPRG